MRNRLIALGIIVLLWASALRAQTTTTLNQTGPGTNCTTVGCINMPLSDHEAFTWADTNSIQAFTFRGLTQYTSAKRITNPDGSLSVDLDSAIYENNGFKVHTLFDSDCFRCAEAWDAGNITFPSEYAAAYPFLLGWNGSQNVTSGTGQVGFGAGQPVDSTVTLVSSRPDLLQVPASIVIPANQFDTDFTITATAPQGTAVMKVIVTATFPDNTTAMMTLTVGSVPIQPPPDSSLPHYLCGSKRVSCLAGK